MQGNQKNNLFLPLFFSLTMVAGMFIGYKLHSNMPSAKSFFAGTRNSSLDEVMKLVKTRYVDTVSMDSLSDIAIESILQELDPHSFYIPKSELDEVNENLDGSYQGIGVEFDMINDTIHILGVTPDGPAKQADIQVGDQILVVNGKTITGRISATEVKKIVRGPQGSRITLDLLRQGKKIKKTLNRGNVPLKSVDASFMLNHEIGYIKLNRFSSTSYKEFMEAIEPLKTKGMKSLVLDLRDNGGGILEEATDIADEFIDGDKLLVYTEGKNSPKKEYKAKRKGIFENGQLVILMNEGSASASEALAGALQDQGKAKIAGKRSFGKGLVQEQFTLSDGSALRLTIARYFTPKGKCIQKPYGENPESYAMEIYHRKTNDSVGGILPDWVIANEVMPKDSILFKILTGNSTKIFAYRYFLQNKENLNRFKTYQNFSSDYKMNQSEINDFFDFIQKSNHLTAIENPASRGYLMNTFKSNVAGLLWGQEGYYFSQANEDPELLEILSRLKTGQPR